MARAGVVCRLTLSGGHGRRSPMSSTEAFEAPGPNRKWIADFTAATGRADRLRGDQPVPPTGPLLDSAAPISERSIASLAR